MTTTDIMTLDGDNFAEMAKAMGMGADMDKAPSKASTLPRLRVWNQPVMGQVEVKGKMKNMEVIPGGMFRLQLPDDTFVYAESVDLRVFVQRFMYKRYVADTSSYTKTVMGEDLKGDMKDNVGGFNCGKPAGYIRDFKALPQETRDLLKQIKRVRVLMGEVKLNNPVDQEGNEVEMGISPFIWEIDNRDAFKTMGEPFQQLGRQKRLPVHHWITSTTTEESLPNGASYYLPTQKLDLSSSISLEEADQKTFADFIEWIGNYNQYIVNSHNENLGKKMSAEEVELVEEFISVTED